MGCGIRELKTMAYKHRITGYDRIVQETRTTVVSLRNYQELHLSDQVYTDYTRGQHSVHTSLSSSFVCFGLFNVALVIYRRQEGGGR